MFLGAFYAALESSPTLPFAHPSDPVNDWTVDTVRETSFLEQVHALSESAGEVVLIFDQFEELLRNRGSVRLWAIDELLALYRANFPLKMVISTREEYIAGLRRLDAELPQGITNRSFVVAPMSQYATKLAIRESSAKAGLTFAPEAIDRVLDWILGYERTEGVGPEGLDEHGSVNMLVLQTILVEAYAFAASRTAEGSPVVIDRETLDRFRNKRSQTELVGGALERWIATALERPPATGRSARVQGAFASSNPGDLTGAVRFLAARIAPHLSAGGFKVVQPETDMLRYALQDWIDNLGATAAFESLLRSERFRLARLFDHVSTITVSEDKLSGPSRAPEWPRDGTIQQLLLAYEEMVRRLQARNIILLLEDPEGNPHLELVHDAFGAPFIEWGKKQERSLRHVLDSLTRVRGRDVILDRLGPDMAPQGSIERIRWQGLYVRSPAVDSGVSVGASTGANVEGVTFHDCDFRGTIFEGIVFRNVQFDGCDLTATLFKNCWFETTDQNPGVRFRSCHGDGTSFVLGVMDEMLFSDCRFTQPIFVGCRPRGPIRFEGSEVDLGLFARLAPIGNSGGLRFDKGSSVRYSAWDPVSEPLLDFGETRPVSSGSLKPSGT